MRVKTTLTAALALALAVLVAGCAAIRKEEAQSTESVLAAAGFRMKPADTPERLANLQAMRPRKIVPREKDGHVVYAYADPTGCRCLYVGDEAAYQRFQQLSIQKQLAQENMMAAQMNKDAALNWGLWGPFWW
jgi:Tfp pilus assembly PilM family ATPase